MHMKMVIPHIASLAAMLLAALSFVGCERTPVETMELSISIYIPDMGATKAETGNVGALDEEKVVNSLQLWVFISGSEKDGELVGYKAFTKAQLTDTGLPHSTTTRFGMPLSWDMFNTLSDKNARVDVYAVANAAAATTESLGAGTTRSELDAIVMKESTFGTDLTMAVPAAGLPMSGVLKDAPVTGSYPVLNVSTVTLIRAVSKIRFVFCQQGTPATDTEPKKPSNNKCRIKSITFGGVSAGHDCQIASTEKLFTVNKRDDTDNLFDISGYTPLATPLTGKNGADLMINDNIGILEHPEDLLFQSAGHGAESAREYEKRLDAAIEATSQYGPIYIRETDKLISGTILYDVGEGEVEATFSMPSGDYLTRNHSWILYAYFSETTKTLQFKIVVLPWDKTSYDFDFKNWTVNVIRRFTIPETDPYTFAKVQNQNGYFDIYFWPVIEDSQTNTTKDNSIKGDILIDAPVGQTICIVPVPGAEEGDPIDNILDIVSITPLEHIILSPHHEHPEESVSEDSVVEYTISCNIPDGFNVNTLKGNYIDLHFCVRIDDKDNEGNIIRTRWIDLDSESIDYYRIYFDDDWEKKLPKKEEEEGE